MRNKITKSVKALDYSQLNADFDPSWLEDFDLKTPGQKSPLIDQKRALAAIDLSAQVTYDDFNLFVLGPFGYGRHESVLSLLEKHSGSRERPSDWVYVNNFEHSDKPIAIELPSGTAMDFKKAMEELIDDLANDIPAIFESEEYQNKRHAIEQDFGEKHENIFNQLVKSTKEKGLELLRTPMGFAIVALKDGKPIQPDQFEKLPAVEQQRIDTLISEQQNALEAVLKQIPKNEKEHRQSIEKMNAEMAMEGVDRSINEVMLNFGHLDTVKQYLEAVRTDLVENADLFLAAGPETNIGAFPVATSKHHQNIQFRRYTVNIMVSNSSSKEEGAPVVTQDLPSLSNLVGRIEHETEMGALITDFTMIKPGDLHRANGGYLVLDARQVLMEPFAWEALKRSLKTGKISIISAAERWSLATTKSLEPDPIPLKVRVVLIGERRLYYILSEYDPDFSNLFKIAADFDDSISISQKTVVDYTDMIFKIISAKGLRSIDKSGIQRVLLEATRFSNDAEKLSLNFEKISDVLQEADYWAERSKTKSIRSREVEKAISEAELRSSRIQNNIQEAMEQNVLLIKTSGKEKGQINALSVLHIGETRFGKPSRITARVRMGKGKIVDIEREVELGGPLHSKGVLILSSYLATHYALDVPMSLWASIVFEQSYGGVDGDSASAAELFALLSALSDLPIDQSYAVTGSVNQHGDIQAIGGVNEKIEGFFDLCKARRLTGRQGVLIPKANVRNLALRERVVEAVRAEKFSIIPIETVGQGIEVLTGTEVGIRSRAGRFPQGTVNELVEKKLRKFATDIKAYAKQEKTHPKVGASS